MMVNPQLAALPAALDLTVYADQPEAFNLVWPSGELPAGVWVAEAWPRRSDDAPTVLPVATDGDTLTITIPDTGLLHRESVWQLALDGRVIIEGAFRVVNRPGPATSTTAVQLVEQAVAVQVVSAGPPALPAPPPTVELAVAELAGDDIDIASAGIFFLPVIPGLEVDVPDVDRPVHLMAKAILGFSAAPGSVGVAIAPQGSGLLGEQLDLAAGHIQVDANTGLMSQMAWARLPPHSPGTYTAHVWAGAAGTIRLRIADMAPPRLAAVQH